MNNTIFFEVYKHKTLSLIHHSFICMCVGWDVFPACTVLSLCQFSVIGLLHPSDLPLRVFTGFAFDATKRVRWCKDAAITYIVIGVQAVIQVALPQPRMSVLAELLYGYDVDQLMHFRFYTSRAFSTVEQRNDFGWRMATKLNRIYLYRVRSVYFPGSARQTICVVITSSTSFTAYGKTINLGWLRARLLGIGNEIIIDVTIGVSRVSLVDSVITQPAAADIAIAEQISHWITGTHLTWSWQHFSVRT